VKRGTLPGTGREDGEGASDGHFQEFPACFLLVALLDYEPIVGMESP